jgi:hypothetical protein
MASLYELTAERLDLQNHLEEMNFDDETIADSLEGESTAITAKIEDYGYVIRNRGAFLDAMDAEIERMKARRDAEAKRIAGIEEWLLKNMQACGISKIECAAFTVAVKENPQSVDVLDESAINEWYMYTPAPTPVQPKPDKKQILADLKAGKEVTGCALKRTVKLIIK